MIELSAPPQIAAAARLRSLLERLGYTEKAIVGRLGMPPLWTYLPAWRPMYMAQLAEAPPEPLNDVVRALYLDEPFDPGQLGPEVFEALQEAGLIEPYRVDRWVCPFVVQPYRGHWLVSDPPGPRGMSPHGERLSLRSRVFSVDASSDLLMRALVPCRPGDRALDVGCGTGTVALRMAGQGATVVGSDVNERAVEMARFNAALNGIDGIDWRVGNMLDPVAGARFDRIGSNLPFVPTPDDHALYWDGGRRGQDLVTRLVAGLPQVLEPGGFAQFTAGVVNPSTEDFLEQLEAWMPGTDYSILVLYGTPQSMQQSIPLLATSEADPHEAEYEQVVLRWRSAAIAANVREVAPSVVTIRHDGCRQRAALPMQPTNHDFGPAIVALFDTWKKLHAMPRDWDAWRSTHLRPVGDVHLANDHRWDGQDWQTGRWRVSFADRPWRVAQSLGRDSVAILTLCDGLRSLEDAVFAFCMAHGKNPEAVRKGLMDAVPSWIQSGILTFVEPE